MKNIVECSGLEAIFLTSVFRLVCTKFVCPYPTQRMTCTRPLTRRVWRVLSGGIIKRKKTSRERANRRRNWRRRRGSKGARQPRAPLPPTQRVVRRGRWREEESLSDRAHHHLVCVPQKCMCLERKIVLS